MYILSPCILLCRIPICNHCQCGDNFDVHVWHRGAAVYFMYQRVPDLYSVLHQPRCGFTDWRCITAPAPNGKQDTGELKSPIFLIPVLWLPDSCLWSRCCGNFRVKSECSLLQRSFSSTITCQKNTSKQHIDIITDLLMSCSFMCKICQSHPSRLVHGTVWPLSVSATGWVHELQITKILGLCWTHSVVQAWTVGWLLLLRRLVLTSHGLCPVSRFACAHGGNQQPRPFEWRFRLHLQDVGGDRRDLLLLCDGNSLLSDHKKKKTSAPSASSWGKGQDTLALHRKPIIILLWMHTKLTKYIF